MLNLNKPLDRRATLKALALILIVTALTAGGWQLWKHHQSRRLDTADVRQLIRKYLRDQTGVRTFEPLAVTGSTNVAASASNDADIADADSKRRKIEKLKKKSQPSSEVARIFHEQIQQAPDYKSIYRTVGQGLALVDQLLPSTNAVDIETALALAADASRAAHDNAVNDWLAARIAEGYLWPGLSF